MPGEFDLIRWICAQAAGASAGTAAPILVPPGDDLAALRWNADDLLLVGIDQVLEGVHFDLSLHSMRQVGRKVMNRNLSDCAAMACLPAAAVVAVALPQNLGLDKAKELYLGLREAGDPFDCPVVGGDTGSWTGPLAVSVAILGRSAGITPITRSGARPGDGVYVTGPLGGSILGRHMEFPPRVALARQLAQTHHVTAMLDISDGLSRDLGHICRQSGVGAVIDSSLLPIHPDAVELSRHDGRPALEHALHDGEDYELLLTTSADLPGAIRVGRITEPGPIWLDGPAGRIELSPSGWEHRL